MKKLQTEFIVKQKEITEDMYEKMLSILPPLLMASNGFLMSEAYDHFGENNMARYAMFFTENGKFYHGGLATASDFKTMLIPDEPEEGKTYALIGKADDKCISNGNSWSESIIN